MLMNIWRQWECNSNYTNFNNFAKLSRHYSVCGVILLTILRVRMWSILVILSLPFFLPKYVDCIICIYTDSIIYMIECILLYIEHIHMYTFQILHIISCNSYIHWELTICLDRDSVKVHVKQSSKKVFLFIYKKLKSFSYWTLWHATWALSSHWFWRF